MKKLVSALLLAAIVPTSAFASYIDNQIKDVEYNNKYGTTKYHQRAQQNLLYFPKLSECNQYKDPKLIQLPKVTPVNSTLYREKLKSDNAIYEKTIKKNIYKKSNSINIEPAPVDFYNVYKICERLIRANNLDYINWRIAIRKSEDYKASSFDGNAIRVHTGLYDSLYNNNDALAFVFAHEMAHQIFGHSQRKLEAQRRHYNTNCVLVCVPIVNLASQFTTKKIESRDSRMMEFMADAEAMRLLITAGYDPQKAINAVTFMQGMPNIQTFWESHPIPAKRIENLQDCAKYINPSWVDMGKNNIYSSQVLQCKKSSDRVSIVINKSPNITKFYEPESPQDYLTRVGYISYKTGDMARAAKCFEKLAQIKGDYVSYLYLSYAYEYLYEQTKDDKVQKAYKETMKKLNTFPESQKL